MNRMTNYKEPYQNEGTERMAQLTRHLSARLNEFFAIHIQVADERQGIVKISIENVSLEMVQKKLSAQGVETVLEKELTFYLQDCHRFEDIDFVWGVFLGILCE